MTARKKIFIILFAFLAGGISLHFMFEKGFHRFFNVWYSKLDEVFKSKTDHDVLFLGNSKVQFGVNPSVVDSVAQCNSFNLGYSAAGFKTQYFLFKSYLANHPAPKYLIWYNEEVQFISSLDASIKEVFYDYIEFESVKNFLGDSTKSLQYLYKTPILKWACFSDYYKTNAVAAIRTNREFGGENIVKSKGFVLSSSNQTAQFFNPFPKLEADTFCKSSMENFHAIVNLCKQNKIDLIVIWPPRANDKSNKQLPKSNFIIDSVSKVMQLNQFSLVRYDTATIFSQSEFIDDSHPNWKGSQHISAEIGNLILNRKQNTR
jgi:hypothetical protein